MRHVIIGCGAAGVSAAEAIRKHDRQSEVMIVAKQKRPPYSLCSLPAVLAGEIDPSKIVRFPRGYFDDIDVDLRLGKEVTKVLPTDRRVVIDGRKLKYDRLLIAPGSLPLVPPIDGIEKRGVFTLTSLEDVRRIQRYMRDKKHAVVIGAGFIGIEAATALRKRGLDITVVEMLDSVLPRMLDSDIGGRLQGIMEGEGIRFRLGCQVTRIIGAKKVEGVEVGKKRLPCEMVVMGIGVRPNIEFLAGSGIRKNMGILVNEHMRTSRRDVYAAGDLTESFDPLRGKRMMNAIWPNAVLQGRIAGENMAGVEAAFSGSFTVNIIDVFGVSALSMGMASFEDKDLSEEKFVTDRAVKKMLLRGGKLVGMQFVGTLRNSGYMMSLMRKGEDISELQDEILDDRFLSPVFAGPRVRE
ncbi:MAG: NAD(P)/FAD-dependent oxidoreductase [Thermoplasmata archaeon]|nr:FAD-dependent oxidoreductase [Candidatus Thermoplasmatota archaeon]MCK4950037.1 NAD(P)/FAD-dependent oxidoreductase [Thermoplasmata archaeon]